MLPVFSSQARAIGAAASALRSHRRGRRFDSYIAHPISRSSVYDGGGIFYICRATVPHMASGLGWHLAVSGFDHLSGVRAVVQSRCARCRLGCNTGALNRPITASYVPGLVSCAAARFHSGYGGVEGEPPYLLTQGRLVRQGNAHGKGFAMVCTTLNFAEKYLLKIRSQVRCRYVRRYFRCWY